MSKDMDEGVKVGTKEQTYGQLCKCIDEQWVKLRSKEGTDKKPNIRISENLKKKILQYAKARVTEHRISSVIMKMLFYKVNHLLRELKLNLIHDVS